MTNLEREAAELTETSFSRWKPYPQYKDSGVEWLGEIPVHWCVERLKFVTTINSNALPETTPPDYEIQYVDISNVNSLGEILEVQNYKFEDAPSRARRQVKHGDIIISTVRTYLKAISFINNPPENLIVSTGFAVLRTNKKLVPEFLAYVVRSEVFVNMVIIHSEGVGYPAINPSRLASLSVWYTSDADEQLAISAFLDRETTQIDSLVTKKRELIDVLQEQRRAVINHAVTKGINPNVPMKESGIEWLGEIPAHWKTIRSKRLFSVRNERARDDDQQLSATQAYGVIPQEEYEERVGRQVVKIVKNLEQRSHVEPDDFVISMRSFQGGLERAWVRGCIRSSYVVLKPTSFVDVEFFMYLFKSASYIQALQATADFIRDGQDLTFRNFSLVDLPLVPIDEQRAIAEYLSKTTREIDQLIEKTSETIDRLQEYRSALISAAVTGKIDVRGEVS